VEGPREHGLAAARADGRSKNNLYSPSCQSLAGMQSHRADVPF
jgi:hypothetical protein